MPIRKISGPEKFGVKQCFDPEHNPPMHWCPEPGVYEHSCPSCGKKTLITVPLVTC